MISVEWSTSITNKRRLAGEFMAFISSWSADFFVLSSAIKAIFFPDGDHCKEIMSCGSVMSGINFLSNNEHQPEILNEENLVKKSDKNGSTGEPN